MIRDGNKDSIGEMSTINVFLGNAIPFLQGLELAEYYRAITNNFNLFWEAPNSAWKAPHLGRIKVNFDGVTY